MEFELPYLGHNTVPGTQPVAWFTIPSFKQRSIWSIYTSSSERSKRDKIPIPFCVTLRESSSVWYVHQLPHPSHFHIRLFARFPTHVLNIPTLCYKRKFRNLRRCSMNTVQPKACNKSRCRSNSRRNRIVYGEDCR